MLHTHFIIVFSWNVENLKSLKVKITHFWDYTFQTYVIFRLECKAAEINQLVFLYEYFFKKPFHLLTTV